MTTRLDCIEIVTHDTPQASVIWLHGLGADGNDFVPVAKALELHGVLPLRFIFPHAPVMPVTINGGMAMRAWYDIRSADLAQREDGAGIYASQAALDDLIDHEIERGIPSTHIVLAGFSQGGAIALHTGLRYPQRLAGIVALSTYLPLLENTVQERRAINADIPIMMVHGRDDNVVPYQRGMLSKQALQQLGYRVEWVDYPMQHSVCEEEITAIGDWLRRVLPAA